MSRAILERCQRRHLVLHMDINKTIIQTDPAGGRSLTDVLNSNVAANVFGLVEPDRDTGKDTWRALYSAEDSAEVQQAARALANGKSLITYADYVDQKFCEPPEMASMAKAERDQLWKRISGERRRAVHDFTFPGALGGAYAHMVDKQRHALTRPDVTAPTSQDVEVEDKPTEMARYYTIIPSFFQLMNCLSELNWPFTLIFRTFGNDLGRVLADWESFIKGQHPCQPRGPVLEKLAREPYTRPLTACVYRERDRLFLCYGPDVSASTLSQGFVQREQPSAQDVFNALQDLPGYVRAEETGFHTLQHDLRTYFEQSHNIGGLVDYYPCWAQAAEHRDGGKVYAVHLANSERSATPDAGAKVNRKDDTDDEYDVFFDDNIALGDTFSIVDIRDAASGRSICDKAIEEPFCVPVNTYKAIVDPNYFIDCLSDRIEKQARALTEARAPKRSRDE